MKIAETTSNILPVSIVIPTHNRAHMIKRAVDSVLKQCIAGDEVIVVDDGSTDETAEVLRLYTEQIIYLRVENGGAGRARNIGMYKARNPIIGFLDSDDEWMPGKLKLQRTFLQACPEVLFCFSDLAYRCISEKMRYRGMFYRYDPPLMEHILGKGVPFSSIAALPEEYSDFLVHVGDLYPAQMERAFVQVNTLMIRSNIIQNENIRFPEDLRTREDWEFVGRISREGLAAYLDCKTSWYNHHDDPQLIKLDYLIYLEARLKMLERLWGADSDFLKDHLERYQEVHDEVYWNFIRELLCHGKAVEARTQLARAQHIPIQFHILSRLPKLANRLAFKLRDTIFHDEF